MARKFDGQTVAVRLAPNVRRQWYQLAAVKGVKLSDVLREGLTIGQAVLTLQAGGSQAVTRGDN